MTYFPYDANQVFAYQPEANQGYSIEEEYQKGQCGKTWGDVAGQIPGDVVRS
jgi:hypothetical protein